MGGLSAERDVSIRTGEAVVAALTDRGYDAWPLFVDRDVDMVLRQARIDVAFIALHGRYGEDGCIQGLLELLGIPYTGSGVLASALAMNKVRAKEVFRLNNLPTAPGYVVQSDGGEDLWSARVVRVSGDCQAGGRRVVAGHPDGPRRAGAGGGRRAGAAFRRRRPRRAVHRGQGDLRRHPRRQAAGRGGDRPQAGFYDFRNKYTNGRTEYHLPARLSPERYRSALRLATLAHEALGCDGATRVDLIVSEKGNEIVLEVNTLPGMTPASLLPKIAHSAGLSFEDLVEETLKGARLRAHGHRRDRRAVQVDFPGHERRTGFLTDAH